MALGKYLTYIYLSIMAKQKLYAEVGLPAGEL